MAVKRIPKPPVSAIKTLRLLEAAYTKQALEVERLEKLVQSLRAKLKLPKGMPDE